MGVETRFSFVPPDAALLIKLMPLVGGMPLLVPKISASLAAQAAEAQAIINAYGILPEQNLVQPGYSFASVPQSISVTYATHMAASVCSTIFAISVSPRTVRSRMFRRDRS